MNTTLDLHELAPVDHEYSLDTTDRLRCEAWAAYSECLKQLDCLWTKQSEHSSIITVGLSALQTEKNKLQDQLNQLRGENMDLRHDISQFREDKLQLQNDVNQLDYEKSDLKNGVCHLSGENRKLQDTILQLRQDNRELQEEKQNLFEKKERVEFEKDYGEMMLDQYRAEVLEQKALTGDRQKAIQDLQERLDNVKAELAQWEDHTLSYEQIITSRDDEIARLQNQLAVKHGDLTNQSTDAEALATVRSKAPGKRRRKNQRRRSRRQRRLRQLLQNSRQGLIFCVSVI
ncbi:unnamed protein product [Clonostachys rhizophaga]|uniref:Uncharacterized protein n=1 Tax=Clonostachys rhizophaga TaxID=160324 RepID=A0A9N9V1S3_9HYPO|nr:unnamed protein product [Clonostachys rhizophaga]